MVLIFEKGDDDDDIIGVYFDYMHDFDDVGMVLKSLFRIYLSNSFRLGSDPLCQVTTIC